MTPNDQTPHPATADIVFGTSARSILEYAGEKGIDLIVMGTHGRGGLSHLLMGSVAAKVVRQAACPVLTVRRAPAAEVRAPEQAPARVDTDRRLAGSRLPRFMGERFAALHTGGQFTACAAPISSCRSGWRCQRITGRCTRYRSPSRLTETRRNSPPFSISTRVPRRTGMDDAPSGVTSSS